MAVDEEILAYYDEVAKMAMPLPANALAMRRQFSEVSQRFATQRPPGVRVDEIVLSLEDRDVRARVYRPDRTGGEESLPLIVYFHGGGWVIGDLDTHDQLVAQLAIDSGCAVVSVAYRMAPETPFPAPTHDALDAVIWIAEHRVRLGFAADRLGVSGDSAGAHLAAYAARGANDQVAGLVTAQLLLYPVVRHSFNSPSHIANANGPGLTLEGMRWFWAQFLSDELPAPDDVRAFPTAQPYGRKPAPSIIVAARFDVLYDDAFELAKFFKANRGQSEVIDAVDMTHGFGRLQTQSRSARLWMKTIGERYGNMMRAPK